MLFLHFSGVFEILFVYLRRKTKYSPLVRISAIWNRCALSGALSCDNLTLIAFSQTRDVEIDGKTIHIISALEWLLK